MTSCMPWFKVYGGITRHPKTRALEEATGNPNALAYVVRLLAWFNEYAPEGRADGARTARAIERDCEWAGAAGALVQALIETGWLDEDGSDLVFHDWDDVQGPHIAKARRDAETKRLKRQQAAEAKKSAQGAQGDSPAPAKRRGGGAKAARAGRADGAETARLEERRVEERREEEKAPLPPVAVGASSEVARVTDARGLMPHEPPPASEPPLMDLLAQDFAAARGAAYGPDRGDDAAMRELLARGRPLEIRRRWRIGIAVPPGKYGRVSKLSDLVRLWNDCDAAPAAAPPGKPRVRALNDADYREGPVEVL